MKGAGRGWQGKKPTAAGFAASIFFASLELPSAEIAPQTDEARTAATTFDIKPRRWLYLRLASFTLLVTIRTLVSSSADCKASGLRRLTIRATEGSTGFLAFESKPLGQDDGIAGGCPTPERCVRKATSRLGYEPI